MATSPLVVETITLFLVVLFLLNKYANIRQQNVIILVAVFIAWYFSFMIIFLLPMDISLVCSSHHHVEYHAYHMNICLIILFYNCVFCADVLSTVRQGESGRCS